MFNIDIDTVVKYLILLFVFVFDPLAICLVIATSESLESRRHEKIKMPSSASNSPPDENADSDIIQMRFVDQDKNVV